MGAYLLRRVLLMVPTLAGVTLLVLVLMALSPGDIGAAGAAAAGGGGTARTRAAAAVDVRYGLHDPVLLQYARWLARVSPGRFGARVQVTPDGGPVRFPRPVRKPTLWPWFVDRLPEPPAASN